MIGRKEPAEANEQDESLKGFDDFDVKLGDIMRGERATMAKSLLDVQRELKIKASYIAAIENSDPTAFDTPGFIAGYVRSYARYLGMDPEWAYDTFCEESGFETAHGMSTGASTIQQEREARAAARVGGDNMFVSPATPFTAGKESPFANLEPRAFGSVAVLLLLVGGLGFGGWTVLQEIQRVQLAPVEQAPVVADGGATGGAAIATPTLDPVAPVVQADAGYVAPNADALDRLYRPQALDVPVLVARDAPISTLDPDSFGAFGQGDADRRLAGGLAPLPQGDPRPDRLLGAAAQTQSSSVQVVDGPTPDVILFAAAPTWVRVQSPDQTILFEKILETGEEYAIPVTEETPILRAGNAGALYFKVNGQIVGPAGPGDVMIRDVELAATDISAAFAPADPIEDRAVFELLQSLDAPDVLPKPDVPLSVSLVAAEDSWVRVRDAAGSVVFEGIIPAGQRQSFDDGVTPATLRAGNAGALFFEVGELTYGPAGPTGGVARNVDISVEGVAAGFEVVAPGSVAGLPPR